MIRCARIVAALLGVAVLAWQVVNAARGRWVHPFLIADLVLAPALVFAATRSSDRDAALGMLAGFSALGGVFLAAATGYLILGPREDVKFALTSAGLVPCVACAVGLGRWLRQRSVP